MRRLLVGLGLAALIGCYPTHPPALHLAPIYGRIRDAGAGWDRYSEKDKAAIKEGKVRAGLDELALYIAKGRPAFSWKTQLASGPCSVLLHGAAHDASSVDSAAYVCNGTIEQVVAVNPELPCWRLAEVVPRVVEKQPYFESQPVVHQWELLEGILKRGQTGDDVYISFGKPYNTGVEAREDGTNAQTRVYLDSTGESYGLYITVVNDKVVGWKIPADRQLTPDAQKKRLEATEARLMSQLKTMEANNEKRHKEQVQLLTDLQSRSDEIVAKQTAGVATAKESGGGDEPKGEDKPARSSSNTLTLNDCTFTDTSGSPDFGKPCDGGGCPMAFTCYSLAGTKGQCVPTSQVCGGPATPPKKPPKKKPGKKK